MAAIGRRSFFGFLFGAAAAAPALPKIVEAATALPTTITRFRGIPIRVIDDLKADFIDRMVRPALMTAVGPKDMPSSILPGAMNYVGGYPPHFDDDWVDYDDED